MFDFTDTVVLITGATGNLGAAATRAFYACHATLILADRGVGRLAAQHQLMTANPQHWLADDVDITIPAASDALISEVISRYGRVDVLVNTVGGYAGGTPIHEMTLDQWNTMFTLNAVSAFNVNRAVIPPMLRQGAGKIINVASRAGLKGSAQSSAYSAAKSAVLRLTESMSAELKPHGINVNCILPGTIDTPQNRRDMPDADTSSWVLPEDITDVILFLASSHARAVHGAAIAL